MPPPAACRAARMRPISAIVAAGGPLRGDRGVGCAVGRDASKGAAAAGSASFTELVVRAWPATVLRDGGGGKARDGGRSVAEKSDMICL